MSEWIIECSRKSINGLTRKFWNDHMNKWTNKQDTMKNMKKTIPYLEKLQLDKARTLHKAYNTYYPTHHGSPSPPPVYQNNCAKMLQESSSCTVDKTSRPCTHHTEHTWSETDPTVSWRFSWTHTQIRGSQKACIWTFGCLWPVTRSNWYKRSSGQV